MKVFKTLILACLIALCGNLVQAQIQISVPDTAFTQGDTVLIPIRVDSSLTGAGVTSYKLELTYPSNYLTPLSVQTAGTISSGLSIVTNFNNATRAIIAAAGASNLSGTGVLFYLEAEVTNRFSFTLGFDAAESTLNEGDPALIFDTGFYTISPKPTITVNAPGNLVLGDSAFATVSSQVNPMIWTTLDPSIATINDSTGLVKIVGAGNFRIAGEDSRGIIDTSNVTLAYGFRMTGTDTTNFVGQTVSNLVNVSDLTALNVKSGSFRLNSSGWANRVELVSLTKGSLLDPGATLTFNETANYIDVAFAQTNDIVGEGDIIQLEFRLRDDVSGATWFTPQNMVFNDDIQGLPSAFFASATALPALSISPSGVTNPFAGDSTQFSVSNNTGPVTWALTDSSLATVDSNGKVVYTKGGSLRVTATDSIGAFGQTSIINVFDLTTIAPDTSMLVFDTLSYPIRLDNVVQSGSEILALDFEFNFNDNQFNYIGFETSGSLTDGWSIVENDLSSGTSGKIKLVGASATPITTDGDLIYIQLAVDTLVNTDQNGFNSLTNVNYNEGSPNTLIDNGNIFISTKPLVPVLLSPTSGSQQQDTSLVIDWAVAVGAETYDVQLGTDPSFTTNLIDSTGVVPDSLPISGLDFFTLYYWRVKAVNTGGESNWSTVFNFRTKEPVPLPPTVSNLPDSLVGAPLQPTFTWGPPPSFTDNYTFQLDTTDTFASPLIDTTFFASFFNTPDSLEIGTDYFWRIRSNGLSGPGPFIPTRTFRTLVPIPGIPTLVIPPNDSLDIQVNPTLNWTSVQFATSYTVQLDDENNFSTPLLDSTVTGTSLAVDSLLFGSQFFWRVRANNEAGSSSYSSVFNFTTEETIPPNVTLTSPADSATVDVTPTFVWSAAQFADNYRLEIATDDAFTTVILDSTTSSTTLTSDSLAFESDFFWRVFASNEKGENTGSETRTFTTNPAFPTVPVLVTPVDSLTDVSLLPTLTWNAVPFADTYTVQLSTDETFSGTLIDSTLSGTSITVTDSLAFGVMHYWRVQATNEVGTSAYSSAFVFTTEESIPPVVSLLSPADSSTVGLTPTLLWTSATFADNYRLELATDDAFTGVVLDTTLSDTSFTSDSLAFDTNYYWRVYASNEKGESAATNFWLFTTVDGLPGVPAISAPLDTSVDNPRVTTASWLAVSDASFYEGDFAADSGFTSLVTSFNIPGLTFDSDSLEYDSTYYFRVRAGNAQGTSAYASVSFTVVGPPNLPPVVTNPFGDTTLDEDFGNITVANVDSVFDDEAVLSYSLVLSDSSVVIATLNSNNIILNAISNVFGTTDIIVTATDDIAQSVSDTLTLNILPVNDAPNAGIVPDSLVLSTSTPLIFNYDSLGADVDNDLSDLTYTFSVTPTDITLSDDVGARELTISSASFVGDGLLTAVVKDLAGDSVVIDIPVRVDLGTSNDGEFTGIPLNYQLNQNYPNPFNPSTTIQFGLPEPGNVRLEIFNLLGQRVQLLVNEKKQAGWHRINFDARSLSSGIYIYRLVAGDFVEMKKMTLIK